MANKFTQSVMDRLEKEAQLQKQAGEPAPEPAPEETPAPEPVTLQSMQTDLDVYLHRIPGRVAKNKTFYLDQAVIDAVRRAAKSRKMTDSQLVNAILAKVLGIAD